MTVHERKLVGDTAEVYLHLPNKLVGTLEKVTLVDSVLFCFMNTAGMRVILKNSNASSPHVVSVLSFGL